MSLVPSDPAFFITLLLLIHPTTELLCPFQTSACSQTSLTLPVAAKTIAVKQVQVGPAPPRCHHKATHTGNALPQQNWDLPTPQLCHCSRPGPSCLSAGPWLPTPAIPQHSHTTQLQLQQWLNTDMKVVYSKSNYKDLSKYRIFEQVPVKNCLHIYNKYQRQSGLKHADLQSMYVR